MLTAISPILLATLFAGVLFVVSIAVGFWMRPARQSPIAIIIAALPALLILLLCYSLAIHMRLTLGGWPADLSDEGFTALLKIHESVATHCVVALWLVSIFAWPAAFLLCLLVRRWRAGVYYLGIYALACLICFGAMLLAPSMFLTWWWD